MRRQGIRIIVGLAIAAIAILFVLPAILPCRTCDKHRRELEGETARVTALISTLPNSYSNLVSVLPECRSSENADRAIDAILTTAGHDAGDALLSVYPLCSHPAVKERIAKELGEMGYTNAAPVFFREIQGIWKDLELISHQEQIRALGLLGYQPAADLVLRILQHQYSWESSAWGVKVATFATLGRLKDPRAFPIAKRYADSYQTDWYVFRGALKYLALLNSQEARGYLLQLYGIRDRDEVGLCLIQMGETSILPSLRQDFEKWLTDFDAGGWGHTDSWALFYYLHAVIIANDRESIPLVQRAIGIMQQDDEDTRTFVGGSARGYTPRLLVDERKAKSLLTDLKTFTNGDVPNQSVQAAK